MRRRLLLVAIALFSAGTAQAEPREMVAAAQDARELIPPDQA